MLECVAINGALKAWMIKRWCAPEKSLISPPTIPSAGLNF
jgi:hypothetical protein